MWPIKSGGSTATVLMGGGGNLAAEVLTAGDCCLTRARKRATRHFSQFQKAFWFWSCPMSAGSVE